MMIFSDLKQFLKRSVFFDPFSCMGKRGNRQQLLRQLYADPLPYNIVSLPPIIPHNPLSLLYYAWVWFTAQPPRQPSFYGVWNSKTRSVHVTDDDSVDALWHRGFFGKGSLSRSEPSWYVRTQRALGLIGEDENLTSEEVTARRRQERREFKRKRAEKEREELRRTYEREGKLVPLPANAPPASPSEATFHPHVQVVDGKIENREHLQLMMEEAFFLSYGLGVLNVINEKGSEYSVEALFSLFRQTTSCISGQLPLQPDDPFLISYVAYHHYRSLGWVVKSGVKFSTDYLLYARGPVFSHAEFAVVLMPSYFVDGEPRTLHKSWHWLHCVNRVNAQVKKTLILAYVEIPAAPLEGGSSIRRTLEQYQIREVSIRRWQPNRMR